MRGGIRLRIGVLGLATVLWSGGLAFGSFHCVAAVRTFIYPVQGPVARYFEEPLGPYASGHRGVDFAVPIGTPVLASNSGVVLFAGPVADQGQFITIGHLGGLETTYSFLSRVDVERGQEVDRGFVIGLTGEGHPGEGQPILHFGVRFHDRYLDPMLFLLGHLDDISDLIALAPLQGYEGPALESRGSTLMSPVGSISPPKGGIFTKIGRGLSALFSRAATMPAIFMDTSKEFASSIWNRSKAVARAVGAGLRASSSRILDGFEAAGSLLASSWRALWKIGKAAARAVSEAFRSAMGWLKDAVVAAAQSIFSFLARMWASVSRTFEKIWSQIVKVVTASAPFRLGAGVVKERQCRKQGGGVPQDIPSVAEMKRGAKPPPPPNDNIVVAVAGIGSYTDVDPSGQIKPGASIYETDFRTLGYPEENIFHFSYEGIEDRGGAGPYRIHAPYEKEDTYKSIKHSARLLARQINEIHRRYPDKEIDIVAHSQGGLVSAYYIHSIWDPEMPDGPELRHFVTVSSPHLGADVAGLGARLLRSPIGKRKLDTLRGISRITGLPDPSAPSAIQMAEGSEFLVHLNRGWDSRRVDTTTIGATLDYVVAPHRAHLRGARTYTADLSWKSSLLKAHSEVTAAQSTKQIIYGALADRPLPCTAWRDAVANIGIGPLISGFVDASTFLVAAVI